MQDQFLRRTYPPLTTVRKQERGIERIIMINVTCERY